MEKIMFMSTNVVIRLRLILFIFPHSCQIIHEFLYLSFVLNWGMDKKSLYNNC